MLGVSVPHHPTVSISQQSEKVIGHLNVSDHGM